MPLLFPLLIHFIAAQVRPTFNSVSNFLSWAPRVALARLLAKWRSLVTIIIGVILGAGIGALIPLYSNAVGQIGMVQRLEQEPAADAYAQMRVSLKAKDFANVDDQITFVNSVVSNSTNAHFSSDSLVDWVGEINPYIRTSKMGMLNSQAEAIESTRTGLLFIEDWERRVRLVEGQLPSRADLPEGANFNVALSLDVASELDVKVGDLLTIDQRLDNRGLQNVGAHETSRPFVVNVSAIIAPEDEEAPFWMALDAQELPLAITDGGLWNREINLLATKDAVQDIFLNYVPSTDTLFGWRILFDHGNLSYTDIDEARLALNAYDSDLRNALTGDEVPDLGYRYHTRLVDFNITDSSLDRGILQDYAKKQKVNNIPFALLLCQVGGLVVFFLMVTAALVRRGERREIAMFQSRGAMDSSLLALRGIEALIICVLGALIAPLFAQRLLIFLGPTIANTSDFPLPLTKSVFAYSFIASGITFGALMLTMLPVLKLPLISGGGTALRSASLPWFQKYYVDIILSVVGLGLLWMLLSKDTPLIETNLGEQRVDFFLLAAPLFLLLGIGSFALRLFPVAATFAATVSSRSKGMVGSMATWQLSREPIHYGRITFLLALAIGIGWFATSFRATVRRSQEDQARYYVGTDVRLYERDTLLRADRSQDEAFYLANSDVEAVSLAHRVPNITFANNQGLQRLDLLAIDPRTFGNVAIENWRSDLGNIVVPYGPNADVSIPEVGSPLPITPTKMGMWVRMDRLINPFSSTTAYQADLFQLTNRVRLSARMQDANGTWVIVPFSASRAEYTRTGADAPGLGTASFVTTGWVYFEADVAATGYTPVGETRLVSIFWENRTATTNGERRVRLIFSNLDLFNEEDEITPYSLNTPGAWRFVDDIGARAEADANDIRPANGASDNLGLHTDAISVTFDQFALWSRMGINFAYPDPRPLEAVVSDSMAEMIALKTGNESENDTIQLQDEVTFSLDNVHRISITLHTQRATEYFPTLFNEDKAFAVVDIREFLYAINQRPSAAFYPDETWLQFSEEITTSDQYQAILSDLRGGDGGRFSQVDEITYANEFDQLETDPLALGLLGLMFLAFVIALALSIVGLLTYSALTAQARRGEFGVLRALGLSSSRVVGSLLVEEIFVVIIASILGSALGFVLSTAVVPTLALGTTGEGVVPPFITETEWGAIANFALIMLGVLVMVFVFSFLLVRQLSLSRTLRLGDE